MEGGDPEFQKVYSIIPPHPGKVSFEEEEKADEELRLAVPRKAREVHCSGAMFVFSETTEEIAVIRKKAGGQF